MKIKLKKQPQKYLDSVDENTRQKLYKALDKLAVLEGDIDCINKKANRYRFKIEKYRIIFEWVKGNVTIEVIEINTRTNIKYHEYH